MADIQDLQSILTGTQKSPQGGQCPPRRHSDTSDSTPDRNARGPVPETLGFSGELLAAVAAPTLRRRGASAHRIATLCDPTVQPDPEPCPYCGRPLPISAVRDTAGEFFCWAIFPDQCENESCRQQAERDEQRRAAAIEAEERAEMERIFAENVERNLRASGLGRKYREKSFDDYDTGTEGLLQARNMVRAYADKFSDMEREGVGLYIAGGVGTGKTHLAAALVTHLIRRGVDSVLFVTAYDLLGNMKAAYSRHSDRDPADVMAAYKHARLLVVDDFGKEQPTEWALGILAEIINARDADELPTVFTSNYEPEGIEKALARDGEKDRAAAITSRISGNTLYVPVVGADYRRMRTMRILNEVTA